MKQQEKWLKKLNSKIILLNENDRKDIISNYREKFEIENSNGKSFNEVLSGLETMDVIANNIYTEFGINYQIKPKSGASNVFNVINSILLGILIILPAGLAIVFALTAVLCVLAIAPAVILSFVNYDVGPAFGMSALFITALPFVLGLFLFLTVVFYKSTKGIAHKIKSINDSAYTFENSKKEKKPKKWTLKLILIGVAIAAFSAALAGNLLAKETIFYPLINNTYLNEKSYSIERSGIDESTKVDVSNAPTGGNTIVEIKKNPEGSDGEIKIVHLFNFKKSQVNDLVFKIENNTIYVTWDKQWFLQALSFGPTKIEVYI